MNPNESMGPELQSQESSEKINEPTENLNLIQPTDLENRQEKQDLFAPVLPQEEADELRNLGLKTGAGTANREEKDRFVALQTKQDALLKAKLSEPDLNNLSPAEKRELEDLNRMQTSGEGWGKEAYQQRQRLLEIARKRGIQ